MLALVDAAEALGFAASIVETIADRFMEVPSVGWSDLHAVGIPGRDIVRLRRHLAGQVRSTCNYLEWSESVGEEALNAVKQARFGAVLTPGCGTSCPEVLRASRGDTTASSKRVFMTGQSLCQCVDSRLHRSPLLCRVCTRIAMLKQGWQSR